MLAEELSVLDGASSLWQPVRPLLDAALRLDQCDEAYSWHGWHKLQINAFLKGLPAHCSVLFGVWDTLPIEAGKPAQEVLVLGAVCEVQAGEVRSIRTFEALDGLPALQQLEPGFEHAHEIMRAAKTQVAPVAWALFTDKATWDEWLFAECDNDKRIDKGALLAALAHQGRCVLLGSQVKHHQ
ncbi:MAG TPA: hypothetical protein VHZ51_09635 [Ktedonobacteraceae bacterium]|nr:hypothetical protein [Ktedonobacteraceae bacterium]